MSEFDPFRAPVADLAAPRTDAVADQGNGTVSGEVIEALRQTKPWVTFLAILGFIFTGICLLVGLILAVSGGFGAGPKGLPAFAGLAYVGFALLTFFPSLFLIRYGGAIRKLGDGGGMLALGEAMQTQKSFWRLIGIVTIVLLIVWVIIIVASVVFTASTALHH